jgi:hypothetical protein
VSVNGEEARGASPRGRALVGVRLFCTRPLESRRHAITPQKVL